MGHSVEGAREGASGQALAHWLTGLVFAVGLSLLIVWGAHRVPLVGGVIAQIEERGVDLTMRLHAELFGHWLIGSEREEPEEGQPPAPPGYLFIDLDAQTCRDAQGDARCDRRSPASPGAAARVANALIGSDPKQNPRVIIIDVRLWDTSAVEPVSDDVARLLARAGAAGTPPILAAAPASPLSESQHEDVADETASAEAKAGQAHAERVFVDWSLVPERIRTSAVQFAPALLWPDPTDGVARRYPAQVPARIYSPPAPDASPGADEPQPRDGSVASLPYLAALYATRPLRDHPALRCAAANLPGGGAPDCKALAHEPRAHGGHHAPEAARTLFTMGSEGQDGLRAMGRYAQYQAQDILTAKGELALPREQVADRIVVIGYSGAIGLDRHATPIGEMAGAQIILNAARSFTTRTELREEPLPDALGREAVVAAASSLPFLPFWWIQGLLWRWANGETAGARPPPRPPHGLHTHARGVARWIMLMVDGAAGSFGWLGAQLATHFARLERVARRIRTMASQFPGVRWHIRWLRWLVHGFVLFVTTLLVTAVLLTEDAIVGALRWMGFPLRRRSEARFLADCQTIVGTLRRMWASIFIVAAFGGAVGVSAVFSTAVVAFIFAPDLARGAPVDALLPLAVLMLESFAHAAKYAIDGLHHEIEVRLLGGHGEDHHEA